MADDGDLSIARRTWRDATTVWRSPWFWLPTGAFSFSAGVAGAALPNDADRGARVGLGAASTGGVAIALGLLVLIVCLLRAPNRRHLLRIEKRLEGLEAAGTPGTGPASMTFEVTGGENTFNLPGTTTDIAEAHIVGGSPQQELQLEDGSDPEGTQTDAASTPDDEFDRDG